jgi:hypothetical protein
MVTLTDFETYIPEDQLTEFRSKDWTVEEVKEKYAVNIAYAHSVFIGELRHLEREDFPIELLPLEEQEQERQERSHLSPASACRS